MGAMFAPGCAERLFINASPFAAGSHPPLRCFLKPRTSLHSEINYSPRRGEHFPPFLFYGEVAGVNPCSSVRSGAVKRLGVRVKTVLEANGMEN